MQVRRALKYYRGPALGGGSVLRFIRCLGRTALASPRRRDSRARLDEPVAIADIAAACAKSPGRLHALFRDKLGTTPRQYVTDRRMTRAAELLARTTLPIAEIALLVGYADQAAFSRAFRRSTGSSPGGFRYGGEQQ